MTTSPEAPLRAALDHALDYLRSLDTAPVGATKSLADLRAALAKPLAETGVDPVQVIDDLVADTAGGLTGTAGGRFFGWVIGGSLPAALAADWLTATWDQNAAAYAPAPAAAVAEDVAGTWLKELLGLPATASFAVTTGSQTAHVIGLAAARNVVLGAEGWDVEQRGLFAAPPVHLFTTGLRHITVDRAIRYLGFGLDSLQPLPVDETWRVTAATLDDALTTAPAGPKIVILQAGELSTGTFDSFSELIDIAHQHRAWVHIDGAFGLWAAASPKYRHLMTGADHADSWVTDGHKWLNVPYDCGFALVAHPDAHRNAVGYSASYVASTSGMRDPKDWNIEMSRRARGFAPYAAIRQLGRAGVAALVDDCCRRASDLVLGIGDLPTVETLYAPTINQGLVRILDPKPGATNADHDRRTDAVIEAIVTSGEALFGGTTWQGKRAMRVSVSNWRTTDDDINRTISAVQKALRTA
jgi:glutamate/tyrosine decarboxylase-like PLP-dependent enzyme